MTVGELRKALDGIADNTDVTLIGDALYIGLTLVSISSSGLAPDLTPPWTLEFTIPTAVNKEHR